MQLASLKKGVKDLVSAKELAFPESYSELGGWRVSGKFLRDHVFMTYDGLELWMLRFSAQWFLIGLHLITDHHLKVSVLGEGALAGVRRCGRCRVAER